MSALREGGAHRRVRHRAPGGAPHPRASRAARGGRAGRAVGGSGGGARVRGAGAAPWVGEECAGGRAPRGARGGASAWRRRWRCAQGVSESLPPVAANEGRAARRAGRGADRGVRHGTARWDGRRLGPKRVEVLIPYSSFGALGITGALLVTVGSAMMATAGEGVARETAAGGPRPSRPRSRPPGSRARWPRSRPSSGGSPSCAPRAPARPRRRG